MKNSDVRCYECPKPITDAELQRRLGMIYRALLSRSYQDRVGEHGSSDESDRLATAIHEEVSDE